MPDDGLCDADLGDVWNQLKARQLSDEVKVDEIGISCFLN